jgi:hypothetical protein
MTEQAMTGYETTPPAIRILLELAISLPDSESKNRAVKSGLDILVITTRLRLLEELAASDGLSGAELEALIKTEREALDWAAKEARDAIQ